jgi:lysophospholipase L1-like esterase
MMKEKRKNFYLSKAWAVPALFLFILTGSLFGNENILSIQGKEGFPYFDIQGNLNIIYINLDGGISLARVEEEGIAQKVSIQDIGYLNNGDSLRAKKDRGGNIWLTWEEKKAGGRDIFIAQLKNRTIVHQTNLTADQEGFNFSPSIDFSLGNDLWAAWVNYSQKECKIFIKNVDTDQAWEIHSPLPSSALSPQIIIDNTQRVWLFWVGQQKNHDEILYAFFDGEQWTGSASLNQFSDVPHITPSVSLDSNGFPHVVWSAFDGDDYELYYTSWDGYKWIKEKKITDNKNTADTCPSITLLFGAFPAVAWSRYADQIREVSVSIKTGTDWSSEILVFGEKSISKPPKIISWGEKIAVLWQEQSEIKTALTDFYRLEEFLSSRQRRRSSLHAQASGFSKVSLLNRDKYIGFGDSITYGIIAREAAPEKGYVPRLEELLDDNIRESEVVNRGVPDEKTADGLSRISHVINEDQAETICLMEGTNDAKDTNISMDTAAYNLRRMAENCLDFGMGVFMASIIPKDPWEGLLKERILDLNEKIGRTAADLDISFVDQYEAFADYPGGWGSLYSDATHPSEQGYQLMARTWYDSLIRTIPFIEIDETSLAFEAIEGESNPSPQSFGIRNSGGGVLDYNISADQEWISVSPESGISGGEWDEIEVSLDTSDLAKGEYEGTITVTDDNAPNSPQLLTIYLTILGPRIELDRISLSFDGVQGESNPPSQTFNIRNSGVQTLYYQISVDERWITVSPESGDSTGEWDAIEVAVSISNLTRGNYEGNVTVSSEEASNSPQVLKVQLAILSSIIELDKTSLSFEGIQGEANPDLQTFRIRNSGVGTLHYQITADQEWITVSPENGDSTGEWDAIEVAVDISSLMRGNYEGNVTISAENTSNSPQALAIQLAILSPTIELDKSSLSFEGTAGEENPFPQTFRLRNSGAGTLHYQITADQDWITVSPESGDSSGEWDAIDVSVNISNLFNKNNQGNVTVRADNASNSPQTIEINLSIKLPPFFPPLNFHGEKKKNRSLSQIEYINILNWASNPQNKFIEKYKIYRVDGENKTLLVETDAQTFEYWHRKVEGNKVQKYGLTAGDKFGRESETVYIEIR